MLTTRFKLYLLLQGADESGRLVTLHHTPVGIQQVILPLNGVSQENNVLSDKP